MQTAIKASQWNLEVLGSKQPKLTSLNPSGAWLPKMLMDSRKLEQRTSPWAAGCFLGLITTLVAASVSTPKLLSDFSQKLSFLMRDQHPYLTEHSCGPLSHTACSKCSPIARWPTVTQAVSLETGCPPLHSCPCPNETLVQSFTLLLCRQIVPWHKD